MNELRIDLRSNLIGAIFRTTHAAWPKVLLISVLQTIITLLIFYPILVYVIGIDIEIFKDFATISTLDPMDSQEYIEDLFASFAEMFTPGNVLLLIAAYIFILMMSSYFMYVVFHLSRDTIHGINRPFDELFKPIDNKVFKLLIAYFLFAITYGIIMTIGMVISAFTLFLAIILMPAALFFISAFFMRYVLTFPSVSLSERGISDSGTFSLSKITYNKGMKYTLIGALFLIGIMMGSSIISLIGGFFIKQNIWVYMGVNQIFQTVLSSYILAFSASAMTCLYVREDSDLTEDENLLNIEDHLVE